MGLKRAIASIAAITCALCAASVDALGVGSGANRVEDATRYLRMDVRDGRGRNAFFIKTPDARISEAWRDNAGRTDKTGATPLPTPGFKLTRTVLVRATNVDALQNFAAATPDVEALDPVAGAPGFWQVRTPSVRKAVALADALAGQSGISDAFLDTQTPLTLRGVPDDPQFSLQWSLRNDQDPLFDANLEAAWDLGYTGAGVVIGIVEGAFPHTHIDLAGNFLAEASQFDPNITPDWHAAGVAGVAGMVAFNSVCGAGAAYGAQISDQLFGTDAQTCAALSFRNDLNDIKNNSWGPLDIAQIAVLPPVLRACLEDGVRTGRGGLGTIYVWAAGNGGASADRVDYDPYASSRMTIAVSAIGDADTAATYNEQGSSMMIVTHSSGNGRGIFTTTVGNGHNFSFGGTSASSPLAAGVIALMLEANPNLTWRDVQHVLINSARKNDPTHPKWQVNGAGHDINYSYGFGALDAGAAVLEARDWTNVAHELLVDTGPIPVAEVIPDNDPTGVTKSFFVDQNVRIEAVELVLNVDSPFIGDLRISMVSPSGTGSLQAKQRAGDGQNDYVDYPFTTLRCWDEPSIGTWTVTISDRNAFDESTWIDYSLKFYGTPLCPGDINADGEVDLFDLASFLVSFGGCQGAPGSNYSPAADFDNNGCIELSDLGQLLVQFGEPCN